MEPFSKQNIANNLNNFQLFLPMFTVNIAIKQEETPCLIYFKHTLFYYIKMYKCYVIHDHFFFFLPVPPHAKVVDYSRDWFVGLASAAVRCVSVGNPPPLFNWTR